MKRFICAIAVVIAFVASSSTAFAQDEVEVSYGGWSATGGAVVWMAAAPVMQLAIQQILSPDDPEICKITPQRCEPTALDYTLVGLTVATTLAVVGAGGWGAGKLAKELEVDPKLGWGVAGGIVGVPVFGLIWIAVPKFEPGWLDTSLGTLVTFGGSIATGFYFADVAGKRGHAWPEFGFGAGGVLVGAGIGSLICGGEACPATPLGGAIGGILGIGLSTLFWGTEPADDAVPAMQGLQQQPLMHYELTF